MNPSIKQTKYTYSQFPANLLKFNTYIRVMDSLDSAIEVIRQKRLAYGEPCLVTYTDNEPDMEGSYKHVLFGIGSMSPDKPYYFGLYKNSSGVVCSLETLIRELKEIKEEFHGKDFTTTSIKFSRTEEPNINDTEFKQGNIILGEAAVKGISDVVEEESEKLVTGGSIYEFVTDLLSKLEKKINIKDVIEDVSACKQDILTLQQDVSVMKSQIVTLNNVAEDVSALRNVDIVKINSDIQGLDTSVINIGTKVASLESDVSTLMHRDRTEILAINSDTSFIKATSQGNIVTLDIDMSSGFSEMFSSDNFMVDASGKIRLSWNSYE